MAEQNAAATPARKVDNSKVVRYNKWGYIFLVPFILVYVVFNLIPLGMTFYYSLFEKYMDGLNQVGPNFVGLGNYISLFSDEKIFTYAANTGIMWVLGFIPQILISLLLAQWFSDTRLRLKGATFFKTVIYLPNIIMASAFAMLFFALFSPIGPVNGIMQAFGATEAFNFFDDVAWTRILVAVMNFLMWFGNTTILLMAGIMGIDTSLYEAAEVDGASSWQRFTMITLPLLKPIFIYVVITSLIGGLQMFDVPAVLTKYKGTPGTSSMTLIMYLNQHLTSKNMGMGGALSVVLFIITGALSLVVYNIAYRKKDKEA